VDIDNGLVGLTGSNLLLDHDYFDHTDRRRIRTQNSSLIVRNSEFADIFPGATAPTTDNFSEQIWGGGIPAGGQFLIENNIFEHLHIGVELSYSAAGCVIANNCILTGQADSGQAPGISQHGVHCWNNLFEGNWSQEKFTSDITHGSGSHVTVSRNYVNGDGFGSDNIPIYFQKWSRACNLVGNLLGNGANTSYNSAVSGAQVACGVGTTIVEVGCGCDGTGSCSSPNDSWSASQVLLAANHVFTNSGGVFVGEGYTESDIPASYYLSAKPAYFGNLTFPAYSTSRTTAAGIDKTNNPAGYRYVFGTDPPSELVGVTLIVLGRVGRIGL
jgi:hypothetical protein